MKITNETQNEKNVVTLEIEVSADEFTDAIKRSYIKNVKRISIQGFRRGKAPQKLIEKYYGEDIFYEDAINFIVPVAYDKAREEKGLEPVAMPEIDVIKAKSGEEFVFTAKITLKPEVLIKDYVGVSVPKQVAEVTDEDVDKEIEKVREKNSRLNLREDGDVIANGDIVELDFLGSKDGIPFEGGKGEGYVLEIGSGTFIPGFEEQITGKAVNSEFDVNVTFPAEYHAPELAGADAVFNVRINSVKVKEMPELDDDFAMDVSEFDTLEEYRGSIRKMLQESAEEKAANDFEEAILTKLLENAEIDIPRVMVDNQIETLLKEFERGIGAQGLTLQNYMLHTNSSLDALKAQFEETAKRNVGISLVLSEVAKLENITATDGEVEEEYQKLADKHDMEAGQIKKLYADSNVDIKHDIVTTKTIKFLVDNAKVA